MKIPRLLPAIGTLALGAALSAVSTPAMAQDYSDEEIEVVGRYGPLPNNVESLSQRVSYADLDLSTDYGWHEFRQRVRLTARYLCDRLGQPRSESPPPSCQDAAERDAMRRFGTFAQARAPRGTTWVAGPAWVPPYPDDWAHD